MSETVSGSAGIAISDNPDAQARSDTELDREAVLGGTAEPIPPIGETVPNDSIDPSMTGGLYPPEGSEQAAPDRGISAAPVPPYTPATPPSPTVVDGPDPRHHPDFAWPEGSESAAIVAHVKAWIMRHIERNAVVPESEP